VHDPQFIELPHGSVMVPQSSPAQLSEHVTQAPPEQTCDDEHAWQAPPPVPHEALVVPPRHCPAEQQPLHEVKSQMHEPFEQTSPAPQVPVWHVPPQPSLAPQLFPEQLAVHPQVPPEHVSGDVHALPEQHGWPFPPHVPQPGPPHACPLGHAVQTTPP
jgi:hypothetical protein